LGSEINFNGGSEHDFQTGFAFLFSGKHIPRQNGNLMPVTRSSASTYSYTLATFAIHWAL
jgi:hypothetical protein